MTATFYVGDAIEVMGKLPEKSVDLVLTSPPFLALRSYLPTDHPDKGLEGGSQATPGEYIDWLLDVVEACERVLAPHGSLCFELGDTYSGSGGAGGDYAADGLREGQPRFRQGYVANDGRTTGRAWTLEQNPVANKGGNGWPLAKSLSLIPETFRFAMVYGHNPHTGRQTAPWRLRNVIRWVRPNPPVGALGDKFRPATSELMVFCKSKDRFFDLDAVREPNAQAQAITKLEGRSVAPVTGARGDDGKVFGVNHPFGSPPLDWWNIPLLEGEEPTKGGPKERVDTTRHLRADNKLNGLLGAQEGLRNSPENPAGAPPLDWWNIPPGGYAGAHYAVWPPELLIKPIKAMCPEKVCRVCGEASRRIVGTTRLVDGVPRDEWIANRPPPVRRAGWKTLADNPHDNATNDLHINHNRKTTNRITEGFSDCGHNDWRPGLVLDCFAGSGITLAVATGHGRDAIGIDLDERNYELALDRVGPLVLERQQL